MGLSMSWSDWWRAFLGSKDGGRASVLDVVRRRYIREKQKVMRYRQHAERMQYPQFRDALIRIADEDEQHADMLAAKIKSLGERLPGVTPPYVAEGQNSWQYLQAGLDDEQRSAEELQEDLLDLPAEFPDIIELFERVGNDGKRHRAQLRDMLMRSDPQALTQT
jgi:rubrerythrin